MNDLGEIIRLVYPLSSDAIELLMQYAQLKKMSRNKLLFTEGGVNNNFYVIKKGLLRFFHINEDKDYTICFTGPGGVAISMHSYLFNKPAMCNIEAMTDIEFYEFSKEELEKLFSKSPEIANWARIMAFEEIYTMERRFTYVGTGDAYTRFKAFMQMRPQSEIQQIPLKHIASYLRITPQTLSRMRRMYARE